MSNSKKQLVFKAGRFCCVSCLCTGTAAPRVEHFLGQCQSSMTAASTNRKAGFRNPPIAESSSVKAHAIQQVGGRGGGATTA